MLIYLFFGIFFLLGALIGSFIAHVVHSVVLEKPLKLWARSSCDHCNRQLSPLDLVPVISYLSNKGVCPSCEKKISPLYPLVEAATALLFGISSLYFTNTSLWIDHPEQIIIFFLFLSVGIYTSATDVLIKAFSIRPIVASIIVSVLSCFFLTYPTTWQDSILATFLGVGFLGLLFVVGHLWKKTTVIGEGDLYLIAFLNSTLGVQGSIVSLYIAILLGAIVGGVLLVYKKRNVIAFAPFLCIGWYIAYFHSEQIIGTYLSFL